MADLDYGDFLAEDRHTLRRIPSEKYPGPEGKDYRVLSLSAKDALKLRRMQSFGEGSDRDPSTLAKRLEATTDFIGDAESFEAKLLGATLEEMLEDGVSQSALEHVVTTLTILATSGEEITRMVIEEQGKAVVRANRADKRAAAKAARTGGGRSTTSPGRAASPRKKPARKAGSSSTPASGAASSPGAKARRTTTSPSARAANSSPAKRTPAKAAPAKS